MDVTGLGSQGKINHPGIRMVSKFNHWCPSKRKKIFET